MTKHVNKMMLTECPDEIVEAFNERCRLNEWRRGEVLSFLLEFALYHHEKLAILLHKYRLRSDRKVRSLEELMKRSSQVYALPLELPDGPPPPLQIPD